MSYNLKPLEYNLIPIRRLYELIDKLVCCRNVVVAKLSMLICPSYMVGCFLNHKDDNETHNLILNGYLLN